MDAFFQVGVTQAALPGDSQISSFSSFFTYLLLLLLRLSLLRCSCALFHHRCGDRSELLGLIHDDKVVVGSRQHKKCAQNRPEKSIHLRYLPKTCNLGRAMEFECQIWDLEGNEGRGALIFDSRKLRFC